MERGFGHTPYGDHFGNCCGLEVVSQRRLSEDTGLLAGFRIRKMRTFISLGRSGRPIDGLFSQSNLGIVTTDDDRLCRRREYFPGIFLRCEHDADWNR